jgi:hypothetical protein
MDRGKVEIVGKEAAGLASTANVRPEKAGTDFHSRTIAPPAQPRELFPFARTEGRGPGRLINRRQVETQFLYAFLARRAA